MPVPVPQWDITCDVCLKQLKQEEEPALLYVTNDDTGAVANVQCCHTCAEVIKSDAERKKKERESGKPVKSAKPSNKSRRPASRRLQSYKDYVDLVEDTVNGVFNGTIDGKKANAIGMLTGYGLQALRACNQGKQKINVFMQDMRRINVSLFTPEEQDRFLQGSEEVQVELLQLLEARGGIIDMDAEPLMKREPAPKTDIKLLSQMVQIEPSEVKEVLSGAAEEAPVMSRRPHKWTMSAGGGIYFCLDCGKERKIGKSEEIGEVCSGDWGLE